MGDWPRGDEVVSRRRADQLARVGRKGVLRETMREGGKLQQEQGKRGRLSETRAARAQRRLAATRGACSYFCFLKLAHARLSLI